MASSFSPDQFVIDLCSRLLPQEIKVEVEATSTPGGDPENIAHVHALPILNDFLLEYDPETDEDELRLALLHEVLHIVFRHVAAVISVVEKTEPIIAGMFEQALEEDTEALARTQVDLWLGLGKRDLVSYP